MSLSAWSLVWQVVIAATCVAFFGLNAYIAYRAVGEMKTLFEDLKPPTADDSSPDR